MFYLKIKSQLHFHYIIILYLISFHFVSSNAKSKRFLQSNYYNSESNYNNNEATTEKSEREKRLEEDPGTFLLAWFFIFFFMGLYIICILKRYKEFEEKIYDIWKFMFFANNGILVASFVNMFSFKNLFMDSSPFALSLIGCGIGIAYYICKFSKNCSKRYAFEYFQYEKLSEFFRLPCFVFQLIGLTDPCCMSTTYTVTYYSDGTTSSTECCMHLWNFFIFIMKRLAVIFSMLSYYIFVIFYLIFWFIGKGILAWCFKCRNIKVEDLYPNYPNPEVRTNPVIEQNIGRQVIINQNNPNNIIIGIPNNNFQVSEKMFNNNNPNYDMNMPNMQDMQNQIPLQNQLGNNGEISEQNRFNNNIPNYDINMQNQIVPSNQIMNNGEIIEQNRFNNNPQNLEKYPSSELPDKAQLEEAINRQNQNIGQTVKDDNNFNNNNINQEQMQQNNMGEMKNDFKPDNNMGPGPI